MKRRICRGKIGDPPRGKEKLKWLGPGLLWMVSSIGSGSILFTPRVGARYGYDFVWLALLFGFFMWVMIREVGRYTVVTGRTIFAGYSDISRQSQWPLYFILIPQILAAVVTVSGIAGLASSALMIVLPFSYEMIAMVLINLSLLLVITGHYKVIENITSFLAIALVIILLTSASKAFKSPSEFSGGLIPHVPEGVDAHFIIPWVGFILAGASGIMWFSYWVSARNFGGTPNDESELVHLEANDKDVEANSEDYSRLKGWLGMLNKTSLVAVVGGIVVLMTFMVLGAELLRPRGIVPEGISVAEDLTKLLSGLWGEVGKWLFVSGILIALIGTILSCQDGYGRMFADGTQLLKGAYADRQQAGDAKIQGEGRGKSIVWRHVMQLMQSRSKLRTAYVSILGGALPIVTFFLVRDPVAILSIAGTAAALHTPVVVFLTLYINRKYLPLALRPSLVSTVAMVAAGVAYAAFAVYHLIVLFQD